MTVIDKAREVTNRRVISVWGRNSHWFADTVTPGSPDDIAGAYMPDHMREMLESFDKGDTWQLVDRDCFPLMELSEIPETPNHYL